MIQNGNNTCECREPDYFRELSLSLNGEVPVVTALETLSSFLEKYFAEVIETPYH